MMNRIVNHQNRVKFDMLIILLSILIETTTAATYQKRAIADFQTCFKLSMEMLKEKDSSLAVLINPETDPNVIASVFPMIMVNMIDIPTEMGQETLSEIPFEDQNQVNFTKDTIAYVPNKHVSPVNGFQYLSMSKADSTEKIRYLLFTKENKNQFQVMPQDGSVAGTKWRPERKVKVIVHGLTSSVWLPPLVNIWSQHIFEIKDAYLKKSRDTSLYNVIIVDWTSLSTKPLSRYPEAALATEEAGIDLAEFLIKLKDANNILNWDDVHVLGHSLGAHVAGIAGSELRKRGENYTLQRITGLDPAGLCFDTNTGNVDDLDSILDPSDAKFVDIIHTNMGNIVKSVAGKYGSQMQTGHADFYPNGGEYQKGCSFIQDRLSFCSHQKSVSFYAQSIWDKAIACPCPSWDVFRSDSCTCTSQMGGEYMGEYCNYMARGKYFMGM